LPAFSQNSLFADTVVSINDVIWTKTEIESSFPGGEEAWNKFMFKVLKKNIDALTDEASRVYLPCKIYIRHWQSVNVEALNMKGSVFARIIGAAIINRPKWIPAQKMEGL
jgi:hypothetical protein